jgi:magnesium transporter
VTEATTTLSIPLADDSSNGSSIAWVALISPTVEGSGALEELGVPRSFIQHALDVDELPRMKTGPGGTLIVLRVPVFNGQEASEPWGTQPVALAVMPAKIVAISAASHPVLDQLGELAVGGAQPSSRLILHALELCAAAYLREVRRINQRVDALEEQIERALGNREVVELVKCQKGFVYFATALRATELLLERLQKSELLRSVPEDHELVEDVRVEILQALDMTRTSADILTNMMDAFASIISNNLNVVMKFLAAFTIILMIPTLVASFWGMNVALPLAHHPASFWSLVAGSALASMLLTVFFVARRWL